MPRARDGTPPNKISTPRKRVFFALAAGGLLLLGLAVGIAWFLSARRPPALARYWVVGLETAAGLFLVFLILGLAGLIRVALTGKLPAFFRRPSLLAGSILLPIARFSGRLFGLSRELIEGSFIEVHNRLVLASVTRKLPRRILVLLPHCLQWIKCPFKITIDLENCGRCRKCDIYQLIEVQHDLGVKFHVATGGGQARRLLADFRPEAVVAVACERELAEGIQDVNKIPVVAVPNERPEGYCRNTRVDPGAIRAALGLLMGVPPSAGNGDTPDQVTPRQEADTASCT
ncbi:MAG: DUF116 domain-containing protein [Firmicutes bacterium]|nr:DUF116 domain-containing protein [Bacillota bacterium]